jgi:alpha-glucosidase
MHKGHLNHSLGSLVSHKVEGHSVSIETANEKAIVTIYSEDIFRVRICKKDEGAIDFSYAVIAEPKAIKFDVKEGADTIHISTKSVTLSIQKDPLRFSFLDHMGEVLNEDDGSFGTSWIGDEVTTYKRLQKGERFIGLGEKTGNLDRRGSAYTNWNTDKFAYSPDQDPLYMTIPFYIGIHSGVQYGIFFDNTYKSKFNFGASNDRFSFFAAEGGEMNYYFIYGKNVAQIIANYTHLTGRIEMPPLWSLGTQQCRYSYYPDTEVLNTARTFREKKIPADMIYLDIHYMDAYKVFTFHPERFPTPDQMVSELGEMGFHTAVILDPGIKVEKDYEPFDEGMKHQYFAKYPDGENYSGEVWPGWSHFPDFTKLTVRKWWGEWVKFYTEKGIDALWNDMNEPAAWGQSLPDLIEFHYEGEGATHKRARNVYGMQMARSTYEGAKKHLKGNRPFILNRAGYSGVQRYTATWTGDNVADSEHMLCGVRLVNSLGLSGIPFAGFDVGGFAGDPSSDLFVKWTVLGAFSPLFRFHSMINSKDAEPWSFGEEAEEISRNYISLRYRLMPYIYAAFYESSQTGMPIARSLVIDYANDEKIYESKYQNQYLFGGAFMIPPIAAGLEFIKVYLPGPQTLKGGFNTENYWYDLHTGLNVAAGEHIAEVRKERYPIFVKGSSIVPMQSLVQNLSEEPTTTLELHLYNGNEQNSFELYEDDGVSYEYERENYTKRRLSFDPEKNELIFSSAKGKYVSHFTTVKLYLHGFYEKKSITINGKTKDLHKENYQFIPPVSSFDPFYKVDVKDMTNNDILFVEFANTNNEITITL